MPDIAELLLSVGTQWIYAVITLLVLAESALFVGFFLPGEASVLLGGMLAATGRLDLAVLVTLVVAAAVVGDAVGFWVGRRCGPWLMRRRTMVRHADRVERLRGFIRRRGGMAILVGRLTALLRAMTPPVAGMCGVSWRTFLAYDALGGVVWAGGVALLGYAAGASYQRVADTIGQAGAAVAAVVIVAGVALWWRRRDHPATLEDTM
jgi:membrane protein DedA with SNARE-associated domain